MSDHRPLLAGLLAAYLTASACGSASPGVLFGDEFRKAPIAAIALDDYASGGTLVVPPGTEFGLQLSGGGWTFLGPAADAPFQMTKGPASWMPDTGFLGPGNCDSASPCGGQGALYKATGAGLGEVRARDPGGIEFDLHLVVRPGPITLDLNALPIPNEALGTSVTMPVGSIVNVHFTGRWSAPVPNAAANRLFAEMHRATSGVVRLRGTTQSGGSTVYSYAITGRGGYAYDFSDLEPSPFSNGYTLGFDVP